MVLAAVTSSLTGRVCPQFKLAREIEHSQGKDTQPTPAQPPQPMADGVGLVRADDLGLLEWEEVLKAGRPVVVAGISRGWPALDRWSGEKGLDRLGQLAGGKRVQVRFCLAFGWTTEGRLGRPSVCFASGCGLPPAAGPWW